MLEDLLEYGDALIGLLGVIVGGTLVALREWWLTRAERKRESSYSAIRLICILEEYAHKCIDVAGDDGYSEGRPARRTEGGEDTCEVQVTTPAPLEYPFDIAWRSLNEALMHRVLALSNIARSTDRYVSASAENAFPPYYEEFFEPRQKGYAKLGLTTLRLVDDLRRKHGVSARSQTELDTACDPKKHLQYLLGKFEERDEKRIAQRSLLHNKMTTQTADQ